MVFSEVAQQHYLSSLAHIKERPYWLDDDDAPPTQPRLVGSTTADLVIVGAGFTGLWAAIDAKLDNPTRDVVLLEGGTIASGASGRNGGFVASSLTHGITNGLSRWPTEMETLTRLGHENLNGMEQFIAEYGIDCDWRRVGELSVAVEPYQVAELKGLVQAAAEVGEHLEWLETDEVRHRLNSPTYLGALFDHDGVATVDPARLAWGMRDVALALGVRIYEATMATGLTDRGKTMEVQTDLGLAIAPRVLLATNAFPPLLRRLKYYIVPVYDSVLVTEPLSPDQWAAIGWSGLEGISDAGNRFHYYRPTAEGAILWGGYDASYHWRSGFGAPYERTIDSWAKLADHFFATFPQLEGLRFDYAWSGAIDTCSRFSAFWGQTNGAKVAYVAGYTGLGVGASRFGAAVANDLLFDRDTQRRQLQMVKSKPVPFPPEPFRSAGINVTRWSLQRADHNEGNRNLWLRTLDRLGMGFDS